jgi:hypothetical protein
MKDENLFFALKTLLQKEVFNYRLQILLTHLKRPANEKIKNHFQSLMLTKISNNQFDMLVSLLETKISEDVFNYFIDEKNRAINYSNLLSTSFAEQIKESIQIPEICKTITWVSNTALAIKSLSKVNKHQQWLESQSKELRKILDSHTNEAMYPILYHFVNYQEKLALSSERQQRVINIKDLFQEKEQSKNSTNTLIKQSIKNLKSLSDSPDILKKTTISITTKAGNKKIEVFMYEEVIKEEVEYVVINNFNQNIIREFLNKLAYFIKKLQTINDTDDFKSHFINVFINLLANKGYKLLHIIGQNKIFNDLSLIEYINKNKSIIYQKGMDNTSIAQMFHNTYTRVIQYESGNNKKSYDIEQLKSLKTMLFGEIYA